MHAQRSRPEVHPELRRFIRLLGTFKRLGADPELMTEVSDSFLQFYPQQVSKIVTALDEHNADDLEKALCELAEAAENFEAPSLAKLTTQLAEVGKEQNLAAAREGWENLSGKYSHLVKAIERFVRVACRRPIN